MKKKGEIMRKSFVIKVIGNFPDLKKGVFSRRFVKKMRGKAIIFSDVIDTEMEYLNEFLQCKKYSREIACERLKKILADERIMSVELVMWGELGAN
jgi:hypothetical protein